jgi:hypothetical protein
VSGQLISVHSVSKRAIFSWTQAIGSIAADVQHIEGLEKWEAAKVIETEMFILMAVAIMGVRLNKKK